MNLEFSLFHTHLATHAFLISIPYLNNKKLYESWRSIKEFSEKHF